MSKEYLHEANCWDSEKSPQSLVICQADCFELKIRRPQNQGFSVSYPFTSLQRKFSLMFPYLPKDRSSRKELNYQEPPFWQSHQPGKIKCYHGKQKLDTIPDSHRLSPVGRTPPSSPNHWLSPKLPMSSSCKLLRLTRYSSTFFWPVMPPCTYPSMPFILVICLPSLHFIELNTGIV